MLLKQVMTITGILLLAFTLAGCSGAPLSTREKGTLLGGGVGAGTGAIIGAAVGHPGAGAAIGGAVGAGTGYIVSNALQNNEIAQRQTQSEVSHQQREIEHQRREIEELQATQETE